MKMLLADQSSLQHVGNLKVMRGLAKFQKEYFLNKEHHDWCKQCRT